MRIFGWAFLGAIVLTSSALLTALGADNGSAVRFAEVMRAPGLSLPQAYWGGVHGEQVLIALALNILFYAIVFSATIVAVRMASQFR